MEQVGVFGHQAVEEGIGKGFSEIANHPLTIAERLLTSLLPSPVPYGSNARQRGGGI
jgi:hypothetical protein